MFTGIVTAIGRVDGVARNGGNARGRGKGRGRGTGEGEDGLVLTIRAPFKGLKKGESIAVNGACLTIERVVKGGFTVHVIETTEGRTLFAEYVTGRQVNLERALRAADRLGGHIVQGHVDGVAVVEHADRRESDDQRAAGAGSGAGGADPVHAAAHDARKPARERPGSRRRRRAGEVREATMSQHTIEQAIADIRAGKLVIVADDESRENEGDLVGAAERVTPAMINFLATHARGLVCLTLMPDRCQALGLTQMAEYNTEAHETAFTVSIDAAARFGVTTGISAADRAATVRVAIDPATVPGDLCRPGHVFPLRARPGGVLQRVGQTEASVDLARLAGLYPAGVICEILNPDGSMARQR